MEIYGHHPHYPQFCDHLQPPRYRNDRYRFMNVHDHSLHYTFCDCIICAVNSRDPGMIETIKPPPLKKPRRNRNGGKLSRLKDQGRMDEKIWKEFPEDLFQEVIVRLPIMAIFQFRSVCKKWKGLLGSSSLSRLCSQVRNDQPWFYLVIYGSVNNGAIYDPSSTKWHHPKIPNLPSKTLLFPVASCKGLICFLDISNKSFYVCNPITQLCKALPPLSIREWPRLAVGMISTSKGYIIVWIGCNGGIEVYDSVKKSWNRHAHMPENIKLLPTSSLHAQAACIGDMLYFMGSEPDGIVSYSLSTGVWKQIIVPAPLNIKDRVLAVSAGRIMLVGLLSKNAATCLYMWELQKMTLLWKEVDRMPNLWCLEFYGTRVKMSCLGNKDIVVLSLKTSQINRTITYNISTGEWSKIPQYILPNGGWYEYQWMSCGTSFTPSLTASV